MCTWITYIVQLRFDELLLLAVKARKSYRCRWLFFFLSFSLSLAHTHTHYLVFHSFPISLSFCEWKKRDCVWSTSNREALGESWLSAECWALAKHNIDGYWHIKYWEKYYYRITIFYDFINVGTKQQQQKQQRRHSPRTKEREQNVNAFEKWNSFARIQLLSAFLRM